MPNVMLNCRPSIPDRLINNPFIAAAHSFCQDDGFGNQVDTMRLSFDDPHRTCYIYAWLEREEYLSYSPIYYGEH